MTPQSPAPGQAATQSDERLRAWLSDLADGQADEQGIEAACAAWRDRADMRQTWHTYQLIGDVLRSDELARPAAHDATFLSGLRAKLAQEPVVMAPMPVVQAPAQAKSARRPVWLLPTAAAAGFVAVASVLVITQFSGSDLNAAGAIQARNQTAPAASQAFAGADGTTTTTTTTSTNMTGGAAMIRDARLDAYVEAHRATRGIGALALPGMGLRNADVAVPAGNER